MKEQETKSVTMFVNVGPMTGCILIWEKIPEALGKYGAVRMYSNDSRDGFIYLLGNMMLNLYLEESNNLKRLTSTSHTISISLVWKKILKEKQRKIQIYN